MCLFEEKKRESLEHSAVARAVQPAVRESLREPGAFPCAVTQRLRARERRGASCVIASGDNPTAAQYVRVSWRSRRESAWVAVSEGDKSSAQHETTRQARAQRDAN